MTIAYKNPNPGESFLGILEGKARARTAAANADAAIKVEQEKQDTLAMQALAAKNGYDPEAAANKSKVDQENAKSKSDIWLYSILAVVVVVVMIGLYFIVKNK